MARAVARLDQGHRFGGAWTELKLEAVNYYLKFFTTVLKDKPTPSNPFELWYIDAFAGSGFRRVDRLTGGLLDGRPITEEKVDLAGSVLKALDVDPPFKRLVFIEDDIGRFRSLEQIAVSNPERHIVPVKGDANDKLQEIFSAPPWSLQKNAAGSHRAVVFLDPYGMSVRWETLKLLAETRAVDVWYLFPTGAVNRQLAGNLDKVDEHKQRALDAVFGTTTWRQEIYETSASENLFAERITTSTKAFTVEQIEKYAQNRLKSIFSYVSEPLELLNEREMKIFSLFCLSNSSNPKAIGLIKNGVTSVLKKHASPASHHKSGR